jgi:hypothetical protein
VKTDFSIPTAGLGYGEERRAAERRARKNPVIVDGKDMYQALAPGLAGEKARDVFIKKEEKPQSERDSWLFEVLGACEDD